MLPDSVLRLLLALAEVHAAPICSTRSSCSALWPARLLLLGAAWWLACSLTAIESVLLRDCSLYDTQGALRELHAVQLAERSRPLCFNTANTRSTNISGSALEPQPCTDVSTLSSVDVTKGVLPIHHLAAPQVREVRPLATLHHI